MTAPVRGGVASDDPVAVCAMLEELMARRPDAAFDFASTVDGVRLRFAGVTARAPDVPSVLAAMLCAVPRRDEPAARVRREALRRAG